ncbi:hypothetical protein B0T26DRAFT_791170 [Lasiosphaeria miniovina]|uniref:Uncharacterized protein n=1 Tax=Lasiosphaeria miniovina TaxID=1954250 RepID=A0AA40A0Q5_9PEZI|nr:uncharacterized protein B0T26DRAFT_791170 [Lasiosphaeria miniovina]KAK0707140.1 hypothetical protein B0T26DRAFT_791170 [Lasiosphaeria miniovina]
MTFVFGTATLVLSATSAKHCNEGIFLQRPLIRSPALGRNKHTFLVPFADIDLWAKGQTEPDRIVSCESIIAKSALSSRGWAAQERIVAKRILHYTRTEMI